MEMKAATILTVLWSFCWMIQGIEGNPVRPSEMRQSAGYGPPLTEAELNCIPVYAKSATYRNNSEGNDIIPFPFASKNAYLGNKWPNPSQIPYEIDSTFDAKGRCAIGNAMNAYHKNTCIRFVPRTNEVDYVQIRRLDITGWSCNSMGLGYYQNYGAHQVNLAPACYASQTGTTMHELMHRVGFHHEHTRPDRDNYVNVIWANIDSSWQSQYAIATGSDLILSYDYGSVMHYGLGTEMTTKQNLKRALVGQRYGFSKLDVMKLNRMYCKL
ncbi:zinc metalloproteinase nas-4-like [Daphnia pulicaria]|uniref:zinc metalloproteinase nas-4-like n=1 Tax=Daphnia pulicaria TaxID=35523 RepID=UPI001EEA6C13|nr:zinc metalloproteinase nas-4-like [Daphnia pulicaria]